MHKTCSVTLPSVCMYILCVTTCVFCIEQARLLYCCQVLYYSSKHTHNTLIHTRQHTHTPAPLTQDPSLQRGSSHVHAWQSQETHELISRSCVPVQCNLLEPWQRARKRLTVPLTAPLVWSVRHTSPRQFYNNGRNFSPECLGSEIVC